MPDVPLRVGYLLHGISMKPGTSSTQLQKGRMQKAVQLWHKVGQLHQEAVTMSQQACKSADVVHGVKIAQSVPEIRADRVAELRAQISAGTYQVNSTAVAGRMLGIQTGQTREG